MQSATPGPACTPPSPHDRWDRLQRIINSVPRTYFNSPITRHWPFWTLDHMTGDRGRSKVKIFTVVKQLRGFNPLSPETPPPPSSLKMPCPWHMEMSGVTAVTVDSVWTLCLSVRPLPFPLTTNASRHTQTSRHIVTSCRYESHHGNYSPG